MKIILCKQRPLPLLLLLVLILPSCAEQHPAPRQGAPPPMERQKVPTPSERPEVSVPKQLPPVVKSGPAKSLYAKAEEALASDHPGQAEMLLERALRIEPRNALYWHLLGQSKYAQGDFLQAVQSCRKSDSLAGTNNQLRQSNRSLLQQAYRKLGNTEQTE